MRTVLYANREVSNLLSEHFILLWTSERPVPRVTIDFGDGRRLERTLTGNAVHYVLDAQGRPLDALPGLYGPQAFTRLMSGLHMLAAELAAAPAAERPAMLQQFHVAHARVAGKDAILALPATGEAGDVIPAGVAIERAIGKSGIELPISRALSRTEPLRMAARPAATQMLDTRSLAVMARELPEYRAAAPRADLLRRLQAAAPTAVEAIEVPTMSKKRIESPLARAIAASPTERMLSELVMSFLATLEEDTRRNETEFHPMIHRWFSEAAPDLETLNERVYREIFLTPRSDPWLGLGAEGIYTGTSGGGRR